MPNIEKDSTYARSVKYLIREELINLSKLSEAEKLAEHDKNNAVFEIRKDESLSSENKKTEVKKVINSMISADKILQKGLTLGKAEALEFILMKLGCATKKYQREIKALEQDSLEELEKLIDEANEDEDISDHDIEELKSQHWKILQQVCEREAAKLKTFQVLQDEKPSKGMIALEKKLSGYTNISMLYGPVEEHVSPTKVGSTDKAENPKRKLLIDPQEVRDFMRKHMVTIYKKQENLTPEEEHVESFNDHKVLVELQKKKLSEQKK